MQTWVEAEFSSSCFSDGRLDERCKKVMDVLSQSPSASIPAACNGSAETMAAYRFFRNENVTASDVFEAHFSATVERIKQESVVLVVQDTTEIDLTRQERRVEGAGPLGCSEARWGIYNHAMLAMTPDKVALGVCGVKFWSRDLEEFRANQQMSPQERRKKKWTTPIEEKESYRWLEGYRRGCEIAQEADDTQVVVISDSEGDIFECFQEAQPNAVDGKATLANWIVRAGWERNLQERLPEGDHQKLRHKLSESAVLGTADVQVNRNVPERPSDRKRQQPRSARTTTVTIQSATIELKGPQRVGGYLPNTMVNAVLVKEVNPPPSEEAIEWLLLTDLDVQTLDQALTVVHYYTCRWQIEIYFRILKSGCRVEQRQFQFLDRYESCLAMYMIIAWRVMHLMMLGRTIPDMSADQVFSEAEWKSVYTIVSGEPAPDQAPPLETTILQIASLGGYLNRRHDPPPGPKAMWTGLSRMLDFAIAWQKFKPQNDSCV